MCRCPPPQAGNPPPPSMSSGTTFELLRKRTTWYHRFSDCHILLACLASQSQRLQTGDRLCPILMLGKEG